MSHRLTLTACFVAILMTPHAGLTAEGEMDVVEGWEHCVVNVATWDHLNVRDEPAAKGEIVATYRYAECGLFVTGPCEGDWCAVEDGDIEGWVNARYLGTVSPVMYCVAYIPDVETKPLDLRAYPSEFSRVILEISPESCEIASLPYWVSGWQKIRIEGHEGWIRQGSIFGQ